MKLQEKRWNVEPRIKLSSFFSLTSFYPFWFFSTLRWKWIKDHHYHLEHSEKRRWRPWRLYREKLFAGGGYYCSRILCLLIKNKYWTWGWPGIFHTKYFISKTQTKVSFASNVIINPCLCSCLATKGMGPFSIRGENFMESTNTE